MADMDVDQPVAGTSTDKSTKKRFEVKKAGLLFIIIHRRHDDDDSFIHPFHPLIDCCCC